jgi:hypothetical protein
MGKRGEEPHVITELHFDAMPDIRIMVVTREHNGFSNKTSQV